MWLGKEVEAQRLPKSRRAVLTGMLGRPRSAWPAFARRQRHRVMQDLRDRGG